MCEYIHMCKTYAQATFSPSPSHLQPEPPLVASATAYAVLEITSLQHWRVSTLATGMSFGPARAAGQALESSWQSKEQGTKACRQKQRLLKHMGVHGATSKAPPQFHDHPQEAKRRRLTETTKETTKETSWEAKIAVDKRILNQMSPRSV